MAESTEFIELLKSYFDRYQEEGDFASGQIDTEDRFFRFREDLKALGYHFTTRSSRKENYGLETSINCNGVESTRSDASTTRKQPGRGSLMYKSSSDVSVPFIGSPHIVETTIYYTCSHGIKYYGSKRYPEEVFNNDEQVGSKRKRRPKPTQKLGCQAKMTVKKIIVFTGKKYLVSKDNWREKKIAIDNLKSDLQKNQILESVTRYCIVISLEKTHNHPPNLKPPVKKCKVYDPVRRVLKLQENIQEVLNSLSYDLVPGCTNANLLQTCWINLRWIAGKMKESIEKREGISGEEMTAALNRLGRKPKEEDKKKCLLEIKNEVIDEAAKEDENAEAEANNEANSVINAEASSSVIELPASVIDGAQVIWDPINVSWVQDSASVVVDSSQGTENKEKSIVLQRKEDGNIAGVLSQGVITQTGQNFTLIASSQIPLGVQSLPFTVSKMVQPATSVIGSPSPGRKHSKKSEMGVAFAIPAGVEWNQQTWGQVAQVVSSDQIQGYTAAPTTSATAVWNIT